MNVLLLGAATIKFKKELRASFPKEDGLKIWTFRHSSPHNDPYFFSEFDYEYSDNHEDKYSTPEDIVKAFQF